MNREAILSIAAKFLFFFPAGTPNWKHNFFSALTQHSQRQTQQSVMPTSYSRSSPSSKAKILLYLMGGGRLGSQRIHSSASLLSTFLSQDIAIHSILSHLPSFLFSAQVYEQKNLHFCIPHLDANLGALQNLMLTQTHMKN